MRFSAHGGSLCVAVVAHVSVGGGQQVLATVDVAPTIAAVEGHQTLLCTSEVVSAGGCRCSAAIEIGGRAALVPCVSGAADSFTIDRIILRKLEVESLGTKTRPD
jgi:proline racemase